MKQEADHSPTASAVVKNANFPFIIPQLHGVVYFNLYSLDLILHLQEQASWYMALQHLTAMHMAYLSCHKCVTWVKA
jgi:hypothetical protein